MRIECFDQRGQIFTHVDSKTGINTVYAVTDIRAACDREREPIFMTELEDHVAKMIQRLRGIEPHRVRRAIHSKQWLPLIYAEQSDGTVLLIDGSHTYVARWMLGHKWANAYVVPESFWRHYTVEGLPSATEEMLAQSWSGIR